MEKASRFHIISLGCAKNTVDSESMAQLLHNEGLIPVNDPDSAEFVIVNTCGFIGTARDESLDVLQNLADRKVEGQRLIAAGCLTQRYGEEVTSKIQGIDGILGTRRWMDIVKVVESLRKEAHPQPLYHLPDVPHVGEDMVGISRVAVQGASAYLKIADGCRRPCAFCAIPLIKGSLISRPLTNIIEEARTLEQEGIRELILIAQDTTDYGYDLGLKNGLVELLDRLVASVPVIDWFRILYMYPGYVSDEFIRMMVDHPKILPYIDIPLQHADRDTLKRMRRPANMDWVYETVEKIRKALPEVAIRTTFIVGYPGESEEAFQALYTFVEEMRFDRVGVFTFSFESGTSSEALGDPIPEEVKEQRREALMLLQQQISLEKNQTFVGKTMDVLVEGVGDGISLGRSYRDAPEIDGLVIIEQEVPVGEIIPIEITGAMAYDLVGRPFKQGA